MYKIEIKHSPEDLKRISIFLDNNHIKYDIKDVENQAPVLEEIIEAIDWPL